VNAIQLLQLLQWLEIIHYSYLLVAPSVHTRKVILCTIKFLP